MRRSRSNRFIEICVRNLRFHLKTVFQAHFLRKHSGCVCFEHLQMHRKIEYWSEDFVFPTNIHTLRAKVPLEKVTSALQLHLGKRKFIPCIIIEEHAETKIVYETLSKCHFFMTRCAIKVLYFFEQMHKSLFF